MSPEFAGFPPAALEFYEQLADNNNREWWQRNKATYEEAVRAPIEALVAEAGAEGQVKVFRPYRDTRFSQGKSPIKEAQGAAVTVEDAIAYYVQINAAGLFVGGGWYAPVGQQVATYRGAVDGPAGVLLERILAKLAKAGFEIDGDPVKTRPRGYDSDNPRIDLLRNRRLVVHKDYGSPEWLHTRETLTVVKKDWKAITPLIEWLVDHVGPGEDPGFLAPED